MQTIVAIWETGSALWWLPLLWPAILILLGRKSIGDLRKDWRLSRSDRKEKQ
jgi:hypothetical protein